MKKADSKPFIGIFGRRNKGKSSFINSITEQEISIVSAIPGTTTDPVKKSMEIRGIGPVILIDTAGIDDEGELGKKRIKKSLDTIKKIDLAILLLSENEFGSEEEKLIADFNKWEVPFLIVHNKTDLEDYTPALTQKIKDLYKKNIIAFSALTGKNKEFLIQELKSLMPESAYLTKTLVGDVIHQGDLVLLITPIDDEAPEGRLILPQVQAIRDILDNDAVAIVAKEREIDQLIEKLQPKPALAICDSQVFLKAGASVPEDIPLTSFSTVLARYKGDFASYLKGTPQLDKLQNGDKVLILESCTHHVSCDDIGRVKLPRWLSQFSGKELHYEVVAGLDNIPGNIKDYAIVIQCGACMITRKQLFNRLKPAIDAEIPVTNYGMAIAYMQGIYQRAIAPFVKHSGDATDYL